MRLPAFVLALSLLATPGFGEQIYLRNRPFKGPSAGTGASMTVGLKEVAEAFELPVAEVNGGFSVGSASEPGPGQVWVNGTQVSATEDAAGIQVNLKEFAEAAGLLYKPNREMGSIDVSLGAPKGSGKQVFAASAGSVSHYNQTTPGQPLDVRSLIPSGVTTFLLVYRDGYSDARYRAYVNLVDNAAKLPDVAVLKVNAGPQSSPLSQEMRMTLSPRLYLFAPNRACWSIYNGHSIDAILVNPSLGVEEVKTKSKSPTLAPFRFP